DGSVAVLTHEKPVEAYEPPAVCGDHIAVFGNGDAYFYALISDGMGSGEDASMTSDVCAMFLEKMLSAGNRVEISLRMLDTYVRSKNAGTGDECSATVDLMELDLMDGRALFAKNGAAPTYVVRNGTVYKLNKSTLPIGILKDTPPNLLRFRTHPGDIVVMVSDGVTLGNDECPWLMDLLSSPIPGSMDALRRDIIKRALSAGSEDDLSAIAIRVEEK
ncbi:MAG: SpoIIE family protein phosphatase, partial [Clostridia bacterium]|nr:SpoIIE family protein phosphatase [Clostridia bacterium]